MADIPKDIREYTENRAKRYDAPFSFPESNKYNVNQHTYPSGVGQSPDLQHYVAFFVNVRGKSKFTENGTYKTADVTVNAPMNSRNGSIDLSYSGEGAATKLSAIAAGAGILGAIKGGYDGITSSGTMAQKGAETFKQGAIGGAKGTALGAFVVGTVATAATLSKTLKADNKSRLKNVITLHLEERPSVKYGINYQDTGSK